MVVIEAKEIPLDCYLLLTRPFHLYTSNVGAVLTITFLLSTATNLQNVVWMFHTLKKILHQTDPQLPRMAIECSQYLLHCFLTESNDHSLHKLIVWMLCTLYDHRVSVWLYLHSFHSAMLSFTLLHLYISLLPMCSQRFCTVAWQDYLLNTTSTILSSSITGRLASSPSFNSYECHFTIYYVCI